MKITLSTLLILISINIGYSQCSPSDSIMNLGDPEADGVLSPHFMEVHAGQEVSMTVTVLSPPGGEGEIGGYLSVPYTMNYFIVKRLENMPSWINYECPNDCRYNVDEYSCVVVSGTVPDSVPVNDSTVMDVIVDANVDASWLFLTWEDYTVEDENGGTLSIRYIAAPVQDTIEVNGFNNTLKNIKISYNNNSNTLFTNPNTLIDAINVYSMQGQLVMSNVKSSNINISGLNKGVYAVELINGADRKISKIAKY